MRSIVPAILDTPSLGPSVKNMILFYDYLSVVTFIFAWIPAMILLRTYSTRLGALKFSIMISLPLIYYLIPFTSTQFGLFDTLRLEYGHQFNLIYSILFAPYKQIGGMLFGMVYLIAASRTSRKSLQSLLTITGIGMTILFASTVTHGLKFIVAPPFGIITISYMGLGSFMLFVGIYYSTVALARDSIIRLEIQKSIGKQFSFLRTLSKTEREQNLEKTVKLIIKKNIDSVDSEFEKSGVEEDYKEMIKEVLDELNSKKSKSFDKK